MTAIDVELTRTVASRVAEHTGRRAQQAIAATMAGAWVVLLAATAVLALR